MFEFRQYPTLTDSEIDISLERTSPANPKRGWAPAYEFKITLHGKNEKIGGISLRVDNTEHIEQYVGHIGYGISSSYRGHRYAAKACKLIKKVALDHGMKTLWITRPLYNRWGKGLRLTRCKELFRRELQIRSTYPHGYQSNRQHGTVGQERMKQKTV